MKKLIKVIGFTLLFGVIGTSSYFGYRYYKKQQTLNSGVTQSIIVPDQGLMYSEVIVDWKLGNVVRTNQSNTWEFENGRLQKTSSQSGTMSLTESWTRLGNVNYISIYSPSRYVSIEAKPFMGTIPDMDKAEKKETLPVGNNIDSLPITNTFKIPKQLEELTKTQSSDDLSYWDDSSYLNYNFRYQKEEDASLDAMVRVATLTDGMLDWYWESQDGKQKVYNSNDEYVLIKVRDFTSCYYISSNNYDFIYMNVDKE